MFSTTGKAPAVHVPRRKRPGSVQDVDVRAADSLGIVGMLKNGAMAVLDVSGSARFAGSPRIELFGSEGTLVYEANTADVSRDVRLGHASGVLPLDAAISVRDGAPWAERVTVYRTARRLMEGWIRVP